MNNRKFGPKLKDHPSIGKACPYCDDPFEEGDFTTLIATEPADDEERAKMEAGRPYTSCADEVHWNCFRLMLKLGPWLKESQKAINTATETLNKTNAEAQKTIKDSRRGFFSGWFGDD